MGVELMTDTHYGNFLDWIKGIKRCKVCGKEILGIDYMLGNTDTFRGRRYHTECLHGLLDYIKSVVDDDDAVPLKIDMGS